jgi:CRISPR-associated protein Cas2
MGRSDDPRQRLGVIFLAAAMHFVIAYDIEQDRRRNQVMSALKDYGLRVQYSVFECDLDRPRLETLKDRLRALIDPRRDRIHIYPMCDACFFRSESMGKQL